MTAEPTIGVGCPTKRNIGVMKTHKTKKTFDAVAFMRKRRDEISKEIEGMTPQQEIAYFKKNAAKLSAKK